MTRGGLSWSVVGIISGGAQGLYVRLTLLKLLVQRVANIQQRRNRLHISTHGTLLNHVVDFFGCFHCERTLRPPLKGVNNFLQLFSCAIPTNVYSVRVPLALRPSLFNETLTDALHTAAEERDFLVDGFIYDNSALLISGDPGSGKSVVALCALAQATIAAPVFDQLDCIRPLNCYCLFSERINREALERLKIMRARVPFDTRRLYLDDGFVGIADVTRKTFADEIVSRIAGATYPDGRTDIVNLDSLYGFIPGGLSKDEKASEFVRFTARLQSELGVSLLMVHHTVKASYASHTGEKIEKDDPFYGSQWLRAGVTGSYYLRRDGDGVLLTRKKDTFQGLLTELPMDYDPETHTVSLSEEFGTKDASDRLRNWLQITAQNTPDRLFSFIQLCGFVALSHQHLRRLMKTPKIKPHLIEAKRAGRKILYRAVA